MVNREPSHPRGEAFVEPELTPPIHCDKVAEPLMGKFMSYNISNPILVLLIGLLLIEQDSGSAAPHH